MNGPTVIILVILIAIGIFAVKDYLRRLAGGCCGGGGGGSVKKRRVSDRDPSHYPYTTRLTIEGMTCQNCVRRVENALNELDGAWATVDLKSAQATVRMKEALPPQVLAAAVRKAGYRVKTAPISL